MKKRYELKQQTPMWHFQLPEPGITLRASEVKPKLDRFLMEWCKKKRQGMDIAKENPSWLLKSQPPAFDYRMTIRCDQYEAKGDMKDNHLHLGNMGKNDDPKECKRRIRVKSAGGVRLAVTILCFHRELGALIDECLPTFFLLHNFGTRQSKGFGSFVLADQISNSEKLLAEWYGEKPIYKIDYKEDICQPNREEQLFLDIEKIYSILKGGINVKGYIKGYLTKYFLDKGIGGEKRWMKKKKIAPIKHKPEHPFPNPPEDEITKGYRYIRGLLGMSPQQPWQSDFGKKTINIASSQQKIARIPSPILFKPVGKQLFILPNDVNEAIYGAKCEFSSNYSGETGELPLPSKDEFDMDKMFAGFVEYINSNHVKKQLKIIDPKLEFCKQNLKIVRCKGGLA